MRLSHLQTRISLHQIQVDRGYKCRPDLILEICFMNKGKRHPLPCPHQCMSRHRCGRMPPLLQQSGGRSWRMRLRPRLRWVALHEDNVVRSDARRVIIRFAGNTAPTVTSVAVGVVDVRFNASLAGCRVRWYFGAGSATTAKGIAGVERVWFIKLDW